jgi:hypothetical protein
MFKKNKLNKGEQMSKEILFILKGNNGSIMNQASKQFGRIFSRDTSFGEIQKLTKEMGYYDKRTTQASTAIRQTDNDRKKSVRKVEEATRKEKTVGVQIAFSKASPN